jgi:hypothetical protein
MAPHVAYLAAVAKVTPKLDALAVLQVRCTKENFDF